MKPMIRRLTRCTLLLALPAALGACAVVPAGPAYGPGVYVAPPPVIVAPAPVYRGYYGGHAGGYHGRGWGRGYGHGRW